MKWKKSSLTNAIIGIGTPNISESADPKLKLKTSFMRNITTLNWPLFKTKPRHTRPVSVHKLNVMLALYFKESIKTTALRIADGQNKILDVGLKLYLCTQSKFKLL